MTISKVILVLGVAVRVLILIDNIRKIRAGQTTHVIKK